MNDSLLEIFERSGDANLGQTLLRLAGMAEAAHRHQMALRSEHQVRQRQAGAHVSGLERVDVPPSPDSNRAHTEAGL